MLRWYLTIITLCGARIVNHLIMLGVVMQGENKDIDARVADIYLLKAMQGRQNIMRLRNR